MADPTHRTEPPKAIGAEGRLTDPYYAFNESSTEPWPISQPTSDDLAQTSLDLDFRQNHLRAVLAGTVLVILDLFRRIPWWVYVILVIATACLVIFKS